LGLIALLNIMMSRTTLFLKYFEIYLECVVRLYYICGMQNCITNEKTESNINNKTKYD
jgi:hypothetical protein